MPRMYRELPTTASVMAMSRIISPLVRHLARTLSRQAMTDQPATTTQTTTSSAGRCTWDSRMQLTTIICTTNAIRAQPAAR